MKLRLSVILSILILFSSVQEGVSQFSSIMFSTESCCASTLVLDEDSACDTEQTEDSDTCCEGSDCDCTCCIHISLFNTSFGELTFQRDTEKDIYNYSDRYGFSIPFPIFHPPVLLV